MNRSLQEILLILAELYKDPVEPLFKALQSGELEKGWNTHQANLNNQISKMNFAHQFPSFSKMKAVYNRCFVGPSEPFAPPVESLYKQWTTDPTAETPIANETGYLYGDPAVHIKHLYNQFNLEIPVHYKNMPDHLGLQLEFLALLLENRLFEQLDQYIDDHFDWLVIFKNKLQLVSESDFYIWITDQLIQTIQIIRLVGKDHRKFMEGE